MLDLFLALAGTVAVCAALVPFLPHQPRLTIHTADYWASRAPHDQAFPGEIIPEDIDLAPDGRTIVFINWRAGVVSLLEPTTGQERATIWNLAPRRRFYSDDGKVCAIQSGDHDVVFINLEQGSVQARFSSREKIPADYICFFLSDGRFVAPIDSAGGWAVVNPSSGKAVAIKGSGTHFSPNGKTLAVIMPAAEEGAGSGSVQLWNTETGALRATLTGEDFRASGENGEVCFSPDSASFLAVNRATQTTSMWEIGSGRKQLTLPDWHEPVFSPDGRTLVTLADELGEARVWDVANGERRATIVLEHRRFGSSLRFSPDGQVLVLLGPNGLTNDLTLWDTATWQRGMHINGEIADLLNNQTAITYSDEGLRLLDVPTGRHRATFRFPNQGFLTEMQHANDGKILFVATVPRPGSRPRVWDRVSRWLGWAQAEDADLKLIDIDAGKELASLRLPHPLKALLSPDERALLTVHPEGLGHTVQTWDVPPRRAFGWLASAPALLAGLTMGACLFRSARRRRRRFVAVEISSTK